VPYPALGQGSIDAAHPVDGDLFDEKLLHVDVVVGFDLLAFLLVNLHGCSSSSEASLSLATPAALFATMTP